MSKKIRLLTIIIGLNMGGAEHMAYELLNHIDQDKYDFKVLCFGKKINTPLETAMEQICSVEYVGHSGTVTPFTLLQVMRRIGAYKPDIVHAHMGSVAFAIPWCVLNNKPIVVTVHTTPEKAFSKKNDRQIRFALSKCKMRLVAVSEDNYKRVCDYYQIHDDRICYVNNGIDIEKYYRTKHESFTYINVARQDDNKNQSAIIRSFRAVHERYPNTMLYLIGDGPCHEALIAETNDLQISDCVVIPGITAKPEDYYAKSDVYVQSSHREAMPLSVLEAMAAGLPVVSTDVGGLRDVVKTNGILVPDGNQDALCTAMLGMIEGSVDQYKLMSDESRSISEHYSSNGMAKAYMQLYHELLNGRQDT